MGLKLQGPGYNARGAVTVSFFIYMPFSKDEKGEGIMLDCLTIWPFVLFFLLTADR